MTDTATSPFATSLLSMLLALGFVLALAWVLLRLLRSRLLARAGSGAAGAQEALQFVRALPVGPKERVVLVDYRGERWMLGVTGGGISVLARFATDAPHEPQAAPAGSTAPPDCGQP